MPTLKDVAKDAGVSIATVSCCLSGAKNVKPETRMKIMDSIEKLKYIPNASARNLKISDSKKIGIILTDIDNRYHAEIFKGISNHLQNKGFDIHVAFSDNQPNIECDKIDDFVSNNVSGLLIITSQPENTDFFSSRILNHNIPAVFIEHRPESINTSFIGFDTYKTTYALTEKLIKRGYRKIALITGFQHLSSESSAVDGYQVALQNYEMPVIPDLIQMTNMTKEDAFKTFLTLPQLDQIDAVITTSENIADGVAEACKILGLKLPQDIVILSFGEESWNHASSFPGIIKTSRTAFTLGKEAARLLLEHIDSPILFEEKTILLTDDVIHTEIDIPAPKPKTKSKNTLQITGNPLRIMMVDLATSRSAKLLSNTFTQLTGIPVEIDLVAQNKLLTEIFRDMERTEPVYDIYMYDVPWLAYMVQNELVADITDFVNSPQLNHSNFFPENLDNCCYDDRYFGVPIVGGSQIMFYRKDLFENRKLQNKFKEKFLIPLRPPRTWTEFNGIASFFTQKYNPDSPTKFGTSMAGVVDEEFAPEILIRIWAHGGRLWDKYNRACVNIPENAQAIHSLLQTMEYIGNPPLETSITRTLQDFCSGQTAMLITYTEYANMISKTLHNSTIGSVGYCSLPGKTPASVGWNLGLNPYSTKIKEAYTYFQWLCQKDTSIYMTILDGQSPVIAPYQSHELLKLYPWLELTEESFQYCRKRSGPYSKKSLIIPQSRIESILCKVLKQIINHNVTIPDALNEGQREMESLFKSYGYPKPLHFLP